MEARKHVDSEANKPRPAPPPMRAPRGVLIRPRQQIRYALVLAGAGMAAQAIVLGTMTYFVNSTISKAVASGAIDINVGETLTHGIMVSMSFVFLVALACAVVAVFAGVKLSHRIYGPIVPFTRHIERLKEGFYSNRMNLRRNDELTELRDALNSLAEELQARHGSR